MENEVDPDDWRDIVARANYFGIESLTEDEQYALNHGIWPPTDEQ